VVIRNIESQASIAVYLRYRNTLGRSEIVTDILILSLENCVEFNYPEYGIGWFATDN
jgi:hypothetical protein